MYNSQKSLIERDRKLCIDCKFFINNVPPPRRWFEWPRTSTDSCYQFCAHPEARDVVDGRPDYAHLERIVGACRETGKNWTPK